MIIIAVYVGLKNMSRSSGEEYFSHISDTINSQKPDGVIYHILGTLDGETRMELIYPPSLNTDILSEALDKLKHPK